MENIQSTWWDDCAAKVGIDASSIKKCAKSKEADRLLKENIILKILEMNMFLNCPIEIIQLNIPLTIGVYLKLQK